MIRKPLGLAALILAGAACGGSAAPLPIEPTAAPTVAPATAPAPTPMIVYVTPAPTPMIVYVTPAPTPKVVTPKPTATRRPTPRPSVSTCDPNAGGEGPPFAFDPSSSDSLHWQEHVYLYTFIKPCPRAGCEEASPDPRFAWMDDWEGPIPKEFQPCLTDPGGAACDCAVTGP